MHLLPGQHKSISRAGFTVYLFTTLSQDARRAFLDVFLDDFVNVLVVEMTFDCMGQSSRAFGMGHRFMIIFDHFGKQFLR
jgi:hypothetical protein